MRCGINNTPPSDDVIPPLTKFHLLLRWLDLLRFRGGKFACSDIFAVWALARRPLCKSRPRLFPFHAALVVCRVVAPTAAALGLPPRDWALTREVRTPTGDAPGHVSAVTLSTAEALAALALQGALRRHVRLHRDSQTAELGDKSHSGNLRPSRH
jgi:hypothetical protein